MRHSLAQRPVHFPVQRLAVSIAAVLISSHAAMAIHIGMTEDFESGELDGWLGSGLPSVIPGGATGMYMRATSFGGGGPGAHMAIHNPSLWGGDYLAAGITAAQVDIANFGSTPMHFRAVLHGQDTTRYTSIVGQDVPADGVWRTYTFSLAQADLVRVFEFDSFDDVITNVARLMFRHDSTTPSAGGSSIQALAGFDNIRTIPAPGATVVLGLGLAGIIAGNRRTRRATSRPAV